MTTFVNALAAVNATLNFTAFCCLIGGFIAIRRHRKRVHKRFMLAAVIVSAVFLVSYLTRAYLGGIHHFPKVGWVRTGYLVLLFSHMTLAALVVPFVLRLLYLAWRRRFSSHKRLAKWAWPVWVYVSITGVFVYIMIYHVAPVLRSEAELQARQSPARPAAVALVRGSPASARPASGVVLGAAD